MHICTLIVNKKINLVLWNIDTVLLNKVLWYLCVKIFL